MGGSFPTDGFMKCAVEIGSSVIIFTPGFVKIDSGIKKLKSEGGGGWEWGLADSKVIS
jgi:predicted cobalt transporter CbtA